MESRNDILQYPPAGSFTYTTQFEVFDPGTYRLCVYLEDFSGADTAPPLAVANAVITVTDPSAAPKPAPAATKCVVPKVVGLTLAKARKALARAHCGVGAITKKAKRGAKRGRVIAQSPGSGTQKAAGSKVKLTVAR